MAEDGLVPIGRVATWFGMRVSALRYYEDEGLLTTHRLNGRRHFDPEDLRRLVLVRTYVEGGMLSLDDVRRLIDPDPYPGVRTLAEGAVPALEAHADRTAAALRFLRHHIHHEHADQLTCPRCERELRERVARLTGRTRSSAMPQIHVTVLKGRGEDEIAALGDALTTAASEALGVARNVVRVTVAECEPEHWFVGGESMARLRATGKR